MQIVIDIPDEFYKRTIKKNSDNFATFTESAFVEIIKNGTPLPKRHGRLIDADALVYNADYNEPLISKKDFDDAPTIIEANIE